MSLPRELLRIGCGAGFWGDSPEGAGQLVRSGAIDVLMLDYLAEVTMSLLARARLKKPELGYAPDFVTSVMAPLAREIAARGIKVVTNAGGVNPAGCRDALREVLAKQGVSLRIAVVTGDDIREDVERLRALDRRDLDTGRVLPAQVASANVYLGAFPIAAALARGADIVITGRCADSALALGPLIAAFDWRRTDLDRLAMGSLAGHVIECGAQSTGGIFTDWREVADDWSDMGFPVVECTSDGSFVATKPAGTGGRVTKRTIAEQITYEIHDPARYLLPDVSCDFTTVHLEDVGPDRVRVSGGRGYAAPTDYKASLTYEDGFRSLATLLIVGPEAAAKAEYQGRAILQRAERLMRERGHAPFAATSVEVFGAETMYGAHARTREVREVLLKVGVAHPDRAALEIFAREVIPAATAMAQGTAGYAGGRPGVQPVVRLASCLVPRELAVITVDVDGVAEAFDDSLPVAGMPAAPVVTQRSWPPLPEGERVAVPLRWLAHGRSGDKGDVSNVSVLARDARFLPWIAAAVTPVAVAGYLRHLVHGAVERYDWPGLSGFNFVLREALGGGGVASLRYDPQGKSHAQILLDLPVPVPVGWLVAGGPLADLAAAEKAA
jgi:hypothetical protein